MTWSKIDHSATRDGMFDVAYTSTGLVISEFVPHAAVPGDYNGDGTVDAADYVV